MARTILQARRIARAERAKRELARRHLMDFATYVDSSFIRARHLELTATYLEKCYRREIKRLMIFEPPRHGKSKTSDEIYPAWALGRDPGRQFMICTNTAELGETFSRNARNLLIGEAYRGIFPGVAVSDDSASVKRWTLAGYTRPAMQALGVGGSPTGKGATDIIIDDPIGSAEEADSAVHRDMVYHWYTDTIRPRLEPEGVIILIMQRWHEDDLAARLLRDAKRDGEKWEIVLLPAIAETQSQRDDMYTKLYGLPAGQPDPLSRAPGEPLWPARWPLAELAALKSVSARSFEAKYQQRPRPAEGATFKRQWLTRTVDAAPDGLRWARYYDLAYSTKRMADNTATISGALGDDGTLYLAAGRAGKLEGPDARRLIKEFMLAETRTQHGVESAMHGGATVQDLMRDKELAGIALKSIHVDHDKLVRAQPVADRAEMSKVAWVRASPTDDAWIADWVDEMCAFPFGQHDDRVDAVSGVFAMLNTKRAGWADYAQAQLEEMRAGDTDGTDNE